VVQLHLKPGLLAKDHAEHHVLRGCVEEFVVSKGKVGASQQAWALGHERFGSKIGLCKTLTGSGRDEDRIVWVEHVLCGRALFIHAPSSVAFRGRNEGVCMFSVLFLFPAYRPCSLRDRILPQATISFVAGVFRSLSLFRIFAGLTHLVPLPDTIVGLVEALPRWHIVLAVEAWEAREPVDAVRSRMRSEVVRGVHWRKPACGGTYAARLAIVARILDDSWRWSGVWWSQSVVVFV
jgi:hypothetical protein